MLNIELPTLCLQKHPEILTTYIFGSLAHGSGHEESDLDLAILLAPSIPKNRYWDYRSDLILELNQCTDKAIDLIILNDAAPFLKFEILSKGKLIYDKAGKLGQTFIVNSLLEYYDFLPLKNLMETRALERLWNQ